MTLQDYFFYSLLTAIAAFTYSYILTEPGEFFGKIHMWISDYFKNDQRMNEGQPLHPLYKMIIGCEKCVAGQIALWSFLAFNYDNYSIKAAFAHVLYVSLTIFLAAVIKGIYIKTIK